MNEGSRARPVALVGICVALAYVLSFLVFWQQPAGGQVSLEPIPILVLSLWRGIGVGTLAGAIEGTLHLTREQVTLHPLSLLLDYTLAGAALGLAGLAHGATRHFSALAVACITLATLVAFVAHVVSGYFVFTQSLRGWTAWSTSLVYNAVYMGPQLVVNIAITPALTRRLVTS